MSHARNVVSMVAVAALVGVLCLLTFGGVGRGQHTAVDRSAAGGTGGALPGDPSASAPDDTLQPGLPEVAGELQAGVAVAADVQNEVTVVAPGRDRTPRGAVEAFTSDVSWILGSEAAKQNPDDAVRVISTELNLTDAEMLKAVPREGLEFRAVDGAYRILGYSGPEAAPDQVMLEIAAPLQSVDGERWMIAGGVIAWVDGRWQLSSLQPRQIPQPSEDIDAASEMTAGDIGVVLDGLGWTTFANSAQ